MRGPRCLARLQAIVAGLIVCTAFSTMAASQSSAQPLAGDEQPRIANGPSPVNDGVQPAPPRDLRMRRDGAVFVGAYGWPYRELARDYTSFGPRYRDYARDYGNFAYHYSGAAPRYRDYVQDYGEFAYDYQPVPSYSTPATGRVTVDVLPTSAQLFVDGQYLGMSYELGAGFALEPGPHRLEIRADDHDPVTLDIAIEAGREIRYEGTLVRRDAQPLPAPVPAPPAAPPTPLTIYFIPRCYLGNVPPAPARLPPGCDINDLKVIPR